MLPNSLSLSFYLLSRPLWAVGRGLEGGTAYEKRQVGIRPQKSYELQMSEPPIAPCVYFLVFFKELGLKGPLKSSKVTNFQFGT